MRISILACIPRMPLFYCFSSFLKFVPLILLLLVLGASPARGDGVFTSNFLATRDGVPVQILAPDFLIVGLAYDPQNQILYVLEEPFQHGGLFGSTLNLGTGEVSHYDGPASGFCCDLPGGLAFDSVQHCLYALTKDVFWQLDLSFEVLSFVPLPFRVGTGVASLAHDPGLDAFWAFSSLDETILRLLDRNAKVLQELDISAVIDTSNETVSGLAFDSDAGTILITSSSRDLITLSRSGDLLSRTRILPSGFLRICDFFDCGLAWFPDTLPESYVAARAGFLRRSATALELYTPPAVLSINGSFGDECREVTVQVGDPIEVFVDAPPFLTSGPFLLFAFPGEAVHGDLSRFNTSLPAFGAPVFPIPFSDGDSSRTILVSNSTGRPSLGQGLFQIGPAPIAITLPQGLARPRTATIQALFAFFDTARLGNAIVLRVE